MLLNTHARKCIEISILIVFFLFFFLICVVLKVCSKNLKLKHLATLSNKFKIKFCSLLINDFVFSFIPVNEYLTMKLYKNLDIWWKPEKNALILKIASRIKNNRLIFNKTNWQQTKTDKFAYLDFCISNYNGEFEFFSFDMFFKNAAEQCLCKPSRKNSLQRAQ
jgi:hypothetical protein